jgi:hypothetical protein
MKVLSQIAKCAYTLDSEPNLMYNIIDFSKIGGVKWVISVSP